MCNFIAIEFDILKLLWKEKELSGREIHELTCHTTKWAHSTTRTVIERMVKKGYLSKHNSHGVNLYRAEVSKLKAFAGQITQFAEKILETDGLGLLPLFAKSEVFTQEELDELKKILKTKSLEKKK